MCLKDFTLTYLYLLVLEQTASKVSIQSKIQHFSDYKCINKYIKVGEEKGKMV